MPPRSFSAFGLRSQRAITPGDGDIEGWPTDTLHFSVATTATVQLADDDEPLAVDYEAGIHPLCARRVISVTDSATVTAGWFRSPQ